MYRQVFSKGSKRITIDVPPEWCDEDIEVTARPYLGNKITQLTPEEHAERVSKLLEFNRKYSFSTKNFKFDRDEANNYDDE